MQDIISTREMGERLAVAYALKKAADAQASSRDIDSARSAMDSALVKMHEESGVDRIALTVGGVKVGQLSLLTGEGPMITDREAFDAWEENSGHLRYVPVIDCAKIGKGTLDRIMDIINAECPDAVMWNAEADDITAYAVKSGDAAICAETGEVIPGVSWAEFVRGTRITGCKPEDVSRALSASADHGRAALAGFIGEAG